MRRDDIDGLRGVAVLAVIAFHAGVLPGGFIGVDVFFVISGYVIAAKVFSEQASGSFSLASFFESRVRRIVPALLVMAIGTYPIAAMLMMPEQFMAFGRELIVTLLFVSNIHFWLDTGYFAEAADLKPLLHTWTLAVEAQFYLVFPFVALAFRRNIGLLAVAGLIVSLGLAQWASQEAPGAGFYLIFTRAWELLAGIVVALHANRFRNGSTFGKFAGAAGLVAVAVSFVLFNEHTAWPSISSIVPVLGTVALMAVGHTTFVGRGLSLLPLRWLGLVSYGAYLWHWPLFVFARLYYLDEPGPAVYAVLTILTFILAAASWYLVEQPIIRKAGFGRQAIAALPVALVILLGSGAVASYGLVPSAMPESVTASFVRDAEADSCIDIDGADGAAQKWFCEFGASSKSTFFVTGDSHAMALFPAFKKATTDAGIGGQFTAFSGCPPLLEIYALRKDQDKRNCHDLNKRVFAHIRSSGIRDVFLVARWTYYTEGGYSGDDFSVIALAPDLQQTRENSRAAFVHGVKATVEAYDRIGVRVHIVDQAPQQLVAPDRVYRQVAVNNLFGGGEAVLSANSVTLARHLEMQSFTRGVLVDAGADIIDLDRVLCDAERCDIGDLAASYYRDDDHLSTIGALRVSGLLADKMRARGIQKHILKESNRQQR